MTVLAIDVGGSGARARLAGVGTPVEARTRGLPIGADGVVLEPVLDELTRRLGLVPGHVRAVCLGSASLVTLGHGLTELGRQIQSRVGAVPTVVASDAATSAVGALGGEPGAVLLAGTGSTALGTDLGRTWFRVDGWGHVLGDEGSGAWIGARALSAALAQHDGRRADAEPLLATARRRFGEPERLVRQVYTRQDRAGLLASFVPDVAALAAGDEPVSRGILTEAGTRLAETLAAALRPPVPPVATYVGGVFEAGEELLGPFRAELTRLRPDVRLIHARGTALDGAEALARRVAADPGAVADVPPLLAVVPAWK